MPPPTFIGWRTWLAVRDEGTGDIRLTGSHDPTNVVAPGELTRAVCRPSPILARRKREEWAELVRLRGEFSIGEIRQAGFPDGSQLGKHAAPGDECSCGIWALHHPARCLSYAYGNADRLYEDVPGRTVVGRILGRVALYGRTRPAYKAFLYLTLPTPTHAALGRRYMRETLGGFEVVGERGEASYPVELFLLEGDLTSERLWGSSTSIRYFEEHDVIARDLAVYGVPVRRTTLDGVGVRFAGQDPRGVLTFEPLAA